MPRLVLLTVALVAALNVTAPAGAAAETVQGEIIVRFKDGTAGAERAAARRAARVDAKAALRLAGGQLVETEPGQETAAALAALRRDPRVEHAIAHQVYRSSTIPGDAQFGSLWGLHNTGQTVLGIAGTVDADIDAPEGWSLFNSAPSVVVAVVDTGVRADHPELDGNLWGNDDPSGGGDQDVNGLIDDTRGYDFVDGDNDPADLDAHGTHVAGTIAAEGDNGIGISGVAWDAQIMPVRVLDENGEGEGAAIVNGLVYAAEEGAKVVNASLGGPGDAAVGAFYDSLFGDYPNTLFVLAAGNDGLDNDATPTYPCNSTAPNVICVAATDQNDALAGFSNYGDTHVDIAAPGVNIRSTVGGWATTGHSDDFSTGLDGWTRTGNGKGMWETFTSASYGGGANHFLSESPAAGQTFRNFEEMTIGPADAYDLAGRKGCLLDWRMYHDYDAGKDRLEVQTSSDGSSWTTRQSYTGSNGGIHQRLLDLRADGRALRIRLRSVADGTLGPKPAYFGSLIDDFHVRCMVLPDPGTAYESMRGTSMAAPHVAGAATLLFGARPGATVAQVRGWLLGSGQALPSLAGKLSTGRRLNLHDALVAAGVTAPPATIPEAITDAAAAVTETTATLRGRVDPNGAETTYRFMYGTAPNALTTQVPLTPVSVGTGTATVDVEQPVGGLAAATTYYFQLVAIQGATERAGAVQSFQTAGTLAPAPPTLTAGDPKSIGTTTATIAGTVNPNGKATDVVLEWGTTSGTYPWQTETIAVEPGTAPVDVEAVVSALRPGTRYVYRFRGVNADGTGASAERSFTTAGDAPLAPSTPQPDAPTATAVLPPSAGTAPPAARVSLACRLTRRKRVACRAGATAAVPVSVRVLRGRRVVARGSAPRLVKGRALRMRTPRRVRHGRYTLRITVLRDGAIVRTLSRTISL